MAKRKSVAKSKKARASWRGQLRFGLVSFAVEAFNARSASGKEISFHQLHTECHSRIHYEKVCPIHGTVGNDQIVSGYEISRGRYVEVEPEELEALRSDRERELTIDSFIEPEDFESIYYDGRMYLLSPANDQAREPYAVLRAAMERKERWGIGQVVFSGQEQLVLIQPMPGALRMSMLNYHAEIRDPEETVAALPKVTAQDRNLKLAEQLVESWSTDRFDISTYEDQREGRLRELIDAKVSGKELVAPEVEEEPDVINLMDALKKSIDRQTQQVHQVHRKQASKKPKKNRRA